MSFAKDMARSCIDGVKEYLSANLAPLVKRVQSLEDRLDQFPPPVDQAKVVEEIERSMTEKFEDLKKAMPVPKDGKDADPIDMVEVGRMIGEMIVKEWEEDEKLRLEHQKKASLEADEFSARVSALIGKSVEIGPE